jgi:Protein of unknown function (DUF2628)
MTVFTVHLPRPLYSESGSEHSDLVRAVFVPEKFSWGAFIFGPLWLISRGLWIAFFLWLVAIVALSFAAAGWLSQGAAFWIFVLIELFLGFEGNNLRRRALAWRGYRLVDIVAGKPQDMAERTFFARWPQRNVTAPAPSVPRNIVPPVDPHSDVLGHFPMPEGRG